MTKRILSFTIALIVIVSLSGCAEQQKVLKLGTINSTTKTITLPSVGIGLFEIKSALHNNGWKLKTNNAQLEEKGIKNQNINTQTKVIYDTAYRLNMIVNISYGHSIDSFNLTIIDNKTNKEIINIVGGFGGPEGYKPEDIAKTLIKALSEVEK